MELIKKEKPIFNLEKTRLEMVCRVIACNNKLFHTVRDMCWYELLCNMAPWEREKYYKRIKDNSPQCFTEEEIEKLENKEHEHIKGQTFINNSQSKY